MRSRAVRMACGSRPLFLRRRPSGARGGGESRLRGVDLHLQGGLVGVAAEVGEEVADLLLAEVDDLSLGGLVDGIGDALAQALEAVAQGLDEGTWVDLGQGAHQRLRG